MKYLGMVLLRQPKLSLQTASHRDGLGSFELPTARADTVVLEQIAKPVTQISGLKLRGFPRKPEIEPALVQSQPSSYFLKWETGAKCLSSSVFISSKAPSTAMSPRKKMPKLYRAALVYVDHSLAMFKQQSQEPCKPHLKGLIDWTEHQQLISRNLYLDRRLRILGQD